MKTTIVILVINTLTVLPCSSKTRADSIRTKLFNPNCKEILVACHRGDWRGYAENSIEGIKSAIEMGADIVEIDLRRTADGHLILMHDKSINRTTTGKGYVSELTLDSIKHVNLRSGVGEWTPYHVPTLEEVMMLVKGRVLVNLDKAFDYFDQVMEILIRTGTVSHVIMKGEADASTVKTKYGKYLDKVIYMPVVNLDRQNSIDIIRKHIDILNPPAFELVYNNPANEIPRDVSEVIGNKSRIWYNSLWSSLACGHDDYVSLDCPEQGWGYLIDSLNASIIQTDQPVKLIRYLKKRHFKEEIMEERITSQRTMFHIVPKKVVSIKRAYFCCRQGKNITENVALRQ